MLHHLRGLQCSHFRKQNWEQFDLVGLCGRGCAGGVLMSSERSSPIDKKLSDNY